MKKELKYEEKLANCVRSCTAKIGKFEEKQIVQVIDKFKNVQPKVTMKVLTQKLLDKYKDSNSFEFKTLLDEVFKLNDGSFVSAQAIVDEIVEDKLRELKNNHRIVNESIQEVCNKFNELGIDYYIVGALPVYLATGKMIRIHEDIDFMVAEKDMPKVAEALSTTVYKLHDNRLDSPRVLDENGDLICGDHEVVADREDDKFHLGFFMFKREKDGSVTQREYHARIDENGKKIPVLSQRRFQKELFDYNYSDKPVKYLNTEFKSSTPESVYEIKSFMLGVDPREKDALDVQSWKTSKKANSEENLIDSKRLEEMSKISQKYHTTTSSSDVSPELIEKIKQQQEEMKNFEQNVSAGINI